MKNYLNSKALTILILAITIFTLNCTMVLAHDEKSEGGDRDSNNSNGQQQTTTITVTAEDYDIVSNDDDTVTFKRADGTAITNATVTVKNELTGQEGDIEMNLPMPSTGIFDYSSYLDQNVQQLRVTDTDTGATLEYMIFTGDLTISAGKNKSGDGSGGGHSHGASSSTMYIAFAGVAVVIAIGAGVVIAKKKKAKAEFEASNSKKKKGKAKSKK